MKNILKIDTIEPLVLRSDTSTKNYVSLNYIPGTVIRGAFANRYIAKYGINGKFEEIFLGGNAIFKNLYPISSRYRKNVILSNPFPKTAYSCKRWPGFPRDETVTKQTHGVYDTIFLRAFSKRVPECLKCGEPLKGIGIGGFYNLLNDGTYASSGIGESKTVFTHTAVRYSTGTAKHRQLYNEEAITENQSFRGAIIAEDQYISFLSTLLAENENILRLGRGRTRGYGKVRASIESPSQENEPLEYFKERIEKFSKLAVQFGGVKNTLYFTIDLISDAIILDDYLRFKKFTDEKYISSLLSTDCKELYSVSNTRQILGWNVAWNLPKPAYSAIEKGSTFLFEAPYSEDLIKNLYELESKGVGIMREEGFGFISISDKFHIDNYFKEEKQNE